MKVSHQHFSREQAIGLSILSLIVVSCGATASTPMPSITPSPIPPTPIQPATPLPTHTIEPDQVVQLQRELIPSDFGLENQSITCADWSPDGKLILSGGGGGSQIIWETLTGEIIHHLPSDRRIEDCEWSPEGSTIVNGSGTDLWIWDPEAGIPLDRLRGIGGRIKGVAISPDSTMVASWAAGERSGRIWSIASGEHLFALPHTEELDRLVWSPDSSALATSTRGELVGIWDAISGEKVIELAHGGIILDLAWSPDGTQLAVGQLSGLTLWDTRSWSQVPLPSYEVDAARHLAWSPEEQQLAIVTSSYDIQIWDPAQKLLYPLATTGAFIFDMSWSPDGRWLAAGSNNSLVSVWDLTTGSWVGVGRHETDDVTTLAWSPDGQTLASADKAGVVNLWTFGQ